MWLRAIEFTCISFTLLMLISLLVAGMVQIIYKVVDRKREDPVADSCK